MGAGPNTPWPPRVLRYYSSKWRLRIILRVIGRRSQLAVQPFRLATRLRGALPSTPPRWARSGTRKSECKLSRFSTTLRDVRSSYSTNHNSSRWRQFQFYESLLEIEETPILRIITLRDEGNSQSMRHYSSRWRKLQLYESILFEMEETPILRIITLRGGGNSHSTNHYSSR